MSTRPRVVLGKPGLDGHDRGVRIIARALREAGCEVIFVGVRVPPAAIAMAAVQEDADVVGLSFLAGGHLGLTEDVVAELRARDADCAVIVGGTIPDGDIPTLLALGCDAVFPVGARVDAIVAWVTDRAARRVRS